MDKLISLRAWCKKNSITYSVGHRWMLDGVIETERNKTGKRILIQCDYPVPVRDTISCAICNQNFPQITSTHLKSHGITLPQYREQYPEASIVSEEVRKKNVDAIKGIKRSDEFKENVSKGRKGIIPKNHLRHQKGTWTPSEETRAKWSAIRTGRKHSDKTKRKIGDAHRGVPETPEAIENNRKALKAYYAVNDGPNKGRVFDDEFRKKVSFAAKLREENFTPEFRSERSRKNAKGKKRTPEQRERYRQARLKYMEEHPEEWQKFSETKLELEFKAWCDEKDIKCHSQCFITYEGQHHPFDFYLPEYEILVECDGPLHWELPWFQVDDPQKFLEAQNTKDKFWSQVGERLGYTVIRLIGRNFIGDEGSGSIEEQIERYIQKDENS